MNEATTNFLIKRLKIEDLDEKNKEIAEILGMESYIMFLKYFGGARIYVNLLSEVLLPVKERTIIEEYNGTNKNELSRKYDCTLNTIEKIMKKMG